jgi:hypothetical protein
MELKGRADVPFSWSAFTTHWDAPNAPDRGATMDTTTLLIIILVIVLLGGGGWYGRGRWY